MRVFEIKVPEEGIAQWREESIWQVLKSCINTFKLYTLHPVLVIAYNKEVKTRVTFNTESLLGRFGMW